MKTKEEVLFPTHHHCFDGMETIWKEKEIHSAMDEYAKQLAIGFLDWIEENVYSRSEAIGNGYEDVVLFSTKWLLIGVDPIAVDTTEQLFNLYIQTIK